MPFKVVQTDEDGELCLSVVPSGWEKDGFLWWPKAMSAAKLMLDESSTPTNKWQRMRCVKKRECRTKLEAEAEIRKMETLPDTEAEEPPTAAKKQRKQIISNSNEQKHVPKNFNEFVPVEIRNPEVSVMTKPIIPDTTVSN